MQNGLTWWGLSGGGAAGDAPLIVAPQIPRLDVPRSCDFNGSDEYLRNDTQNTLGVANQFTLNAWIFPRDASGNQTYFNTRPDDSTGDENTIDLSIVPAGTNNPYRAELRDSGGTVQKRFLFGSYTGSAWTMLTMTFDGAAGGDPLLVYEDGVDVTGSATLSIDNACTMSDSPGRRVWVFTNPGLTLLPDGLCHKISLWSSVLSAAEITAIYNSGNGGDFDETSDSGSYVSSANLQHHWNFRNIDSPGEDSGVGTAIDINADGQNIDETDIVTTVP